MDPSGRFSPQEALAGQQVGGAGRGHPGRALGRAPAACLPPRRRPLPPSPPRGHYFEVREWESPILKLSAVPLSFVRPSAARVPCTRGAPIWEPFRVPILPRSARMPPLRERRAHAPPDSRSHWLLPVANTRDQRRRARPAPPPAPPRGLPQPATPSAPRRVPAKVA